MKHSKTLRLAAVFAVASLMTTAGAASASTFTSNGGTYTQSITATSTNMTLSGSFITISCTHSQFTAQVQKHGSTKNAGGAINSLSFTGCNYTMTVKNNGSMDVNGSGYLDLFNTQIVAHTSVGECVFTADSAFGGGTEMGKLTEGKGAVFDFSPGEIPRTGGSFFCGSVGHWTGNYTVTTPTELSVH